MTSTYGTCVLQFPSSYVPMDMEELEYLEGGGTVSIKVGVCFTVGGLVSGLLNGIISGMVGALGGGLLGGGVTAYLFEKFIGNALSSAINNALPNKGGYYSKTINFSVSNALLPNFSYTKYFDIAGLAGFGGGAAGGCAAVAIRSAGRVVAYAYA